VHPHRIIVCFYYQLDAQILYFNIFIILLYMFRALLFSSSGGQIVLIQHLVPSLSLGDCSVQRLRERHLRFGGDERIKYKHCRWTLWFVQSPLARARLQKQSTDTRLQAGRPRATGLSHASYFSQDAMLLAEAQTNPFIGSRRYKAATDIPGQKRTTIATLKRNGVSKQTSHREPKNII